ncbi:MAG TPA: class I SAM-dependent methyltransferase [Candidatus Angelobacter sp.]
MNRGFYGQDLASLHDRHYSDFVDRAAPEALRMLRAAGVKNGMVCDLGCGGGQLAASLLRAGYDVIGMDLSAAMIAIARKRAPGARFIQGSVADVDLPACAAAIAIGEVFNYLPSQNAVLRAFRNIYHALRSGGILLFDIKEAPATPTSGIAARVGKDWAVIAEIDEDPARKKLTRTIHSFRRSGRHYRRQIEIHHVRIYPVAEVLRLLRCAGFRARSYAGYGRHKLGPERRVLLAIKPANNELQP